MINDIDINEIVAFNQLPFCKQDFIYFIGYKNDKNIRLLRIFFPKVSAYRMDIDEIKCMYFMAKEEKTFHKYMESWEKVSNTTTKINSEVIYSKKYLIA